MVITNFCVRHQPKVKQLPNSLEHLVGMTPENCAIADYRVSDKIIRFFSERIPKIKRKYHTAEQIVNKLRDADALTDSGQTLGDICRQLSISETTYYNWRRQQRNPRVMVRTAVR